MVSFEGGFVPFFEWADCDSAVIRVVQNCCCGRGDGVEKFYGSIAMSRNSRKSMRLRRLMTRSVIFILQPWGSLVKILA
jgi:hypothetical protein